MKASQWKDLEEVVVRGGAGAGKGRNVNDVTLVSINECTNEQRREGDLTFEGFPCR